MTRKQFDRLHPKVTRSLKNFILSYEKTMDEETYARFLASLDDALKMVFKDIMSVQQGPERARRLHQMVEVEIARETKIQISCSKGCSACCHMEVEITNYEAEILAELQQSAEAVANARLALQSQRGIQDKIWREGTRNRANRCIFLGDDNACSIYEDRPVMCRRHSVTSDPVNCNTPDSEISIRFFPKVDMLISAANEDANLKIGPLAKMLSLQLKKRLTEI